MNEYTFGRKSLEQLATCHPVLREIAQYALRVSPYDFSILYGWRNQEMQDYLVSIGMSKTKWPNSRHNRSLDSTSPRQTEISDALDFAPYIKHGIDWRDTHIFAAVAGCLMSSAKMMGYRLRWGGDWDGDGSTKDQTFMDWGHVELLW